MKLHIKLVLLVALLSFLLILLAMPVLAQEVALQPGTAMGRIPSVSIKAELSNNAATLATLEEGETVNVIELNGGWAHVEFGDVTGWALSRNLINVSAPVPFPRGYHRMVYDVESDRIILSSGITWKTPGSFSFYIHNDTWAYDINTNTWTLMNAAQSPSEGNGPMAYDVQSDRVILYLTGDWNAPFKRILRETWAYDFNTDSWTNMKPEVSPPPLLGAMMVYDSESDRMILFSGLDMENSSPPNHWIFPNETWAYDFDANTWTKMNPEVSPPGRNYHAMAYDAQADRVVMFGSVVAADNPDGFETLNDTWVYDYNTDTWQLMETGKAPSPRGYSDMVYSDNLKQIILFGGVYEFRGQEDALGDTWAYDFAANTWSQLHPAVSPSERGWHRMVYSPSSDRIVLFGGGTDREHFTLETWVYNPNDNSWTRSDS